MNGREKDAVALLDGFANETGGTVPAQIAFLLADSKGGARKLPSHGLKAAAMASDVFARFMASAYARAGQCG